MLLEFVLVKFFKQNFSKVLTVLYIFLVNNLRKIET